MSPRAPRVLANLLDNAVKYTETGGQVKVSVTKGDGRVHVLVRTPGSGSPKITFLTFSDHFLSGRKKQIEAWERARINVGEGIR